jgi:DeoR/GlpR family transcriptional regulator of sugar metabolism
VSLKQLAEHLDSSNATLRSNLQEAILRVHNAGYILRNHPGLTHKTAKDIGDEESV